MATAMVVGAVMVLWGSAQAEGLCHGIVAQASACAVSSQQTRRGSCGLGRHLAEVRDGFGSGLDERVHLLLRVAAAEGEAQAAAGLLAREPDGGQLVRGL